MKLTPLHRMNVHLCWQNTVKDMMSTCSRSKMCLVLLNYKTVTILVRQEHNRKTQCVQWSTTYTQLNSLTSEREVWWGNSVNFWDHFKWQSQHERPGWTLKPRAFLKPCPLLDSSHTPQDSEQPSRSQVFRFTFYFSGLETTHPFCRSLQSLLRTLGWRSHQPCSRLRK